MTSYKPKPQRVVLRFKFMIGAGQCVMKHGWLAVLGLIVVAPGQGVSPLDVISDPVPELRLGSGILELGEQGDPVISYRGHDSLSL